MKLVIRHRLNGLEARSLFENSEGYQEYLERNIKRKLGDATTKFMSFEEITDPENPKPPLSELVKPSLYSAFPPSQSHMYPEYEASVHVFTNEEIRQMLILVQDLRHTSEWSEVRNKSEELRRALMS